MAAQPPKPKTSPKSIKFLFGGLAGMAATVFVQPLDLVKNRMQLSGQGSKAREYKTSLHAVASILRHEGVRGIYTGLSAGLLRQATYTTTRLGIYTVLFERMSKPDGTPPNFFLKALIGMTAGATGAFVGTPAEVALIRMTSDGRLPPDQRRGYTNVFNALIRITREEGVTTLWRVGIIFALFLPDVVLELSTSVCELIMDLSVTRIKEAYCYLEACCSEGRLADKVFLIVYLTVLVFSRTRFTSSSISEDRFQYSRTEVQRTVKIPGCCSCAATNQGCIGCFLAKRDESHNSLFPKFAFGKQVSKTGLAKTTSTIFAFLVLRNTQEVESRMQAGRQEVESRWQAGRQEVESRWQAGRQEVTRVLRAMQWCLS
uniref:Solute carrier family 25 member 11 n=1 Tax=Paramormyrops kingsleyae TaxID=1676925 RepID=A0A3B3RUM6_9TELE